MMTPDEAKSAVRELLSTSDRTIEQVRSVTDIFTPENIGAWSDDDVVDFAVPLISRIDAQALRTDLYGELMRRNGTCRQAVTKLADEVENAKTGLELWCVCACVKTFQEMLSPSLVEAFVGRCVASIFDSWGTDLSVALARELVRCVGKPGRVLALATESDCWGIRGRCDVVQSLKIFFGNTPLSGQMCMGCQESGEVCFVGPKGQACFDCVSNNSIRTRQCVFCGVDAVGVCLSCRSILTRIFKIPSGEIGKPISE